MIQWRDSKAAPAASVPAQHSPVPELTDAIFRSDGWMVEKLGLEHRPQQERMAQAVSRAMAGDDGLLFEAGTGVGKSLAYLVPGIINAIETGRPFLVSTHTISLQEQIEKKDLQLCRELFLAVPALQRYAGFKVAFLVGRGNYVCLKRLLRAREERIDLFSAGEDDLLDELAGWAQQTSTGLRQELDVRVNADLWEAVNADSTSCNRKECPAKNCFFHAARERVQSAQVVIVNHSLLFALLGAGMAPAGDKRGVLFPDDFLVIDEAHTLPQIATQHLGVAVSSYGVSRLLKSLYNPKKKKGLLRRIGTANDHRLLGQCLESCREFFAAVDLLMPPDRRQMRLFEPDWIEPVYSAPLAELSRRLKALAQQQLNEDKANELRDRQSRLDHMRAVLDRFVAMDFEDEVPWVERGGRRERIISLESAPIEVAPQLRDLLFRRRVSVVLTSATLATGRDMGKFQEMVGAEGLETGCENSPFDYERNVTIDIVADGPAFTGGSSPAMVKHWLKHLQVLIPAEAGGALVLFTSYEELGKVASALQPLMEQLGRPLLWQETGSNRATLLAEFKKAGNAVLLGTETFWTGVDVPGPALSQVIITKLPFENPGHPVLQARQERIRERGGVPFLEMTLPEAVVRFRQGIGRLIRSKQDRGRIVVLDPRVLGKPYGRAFVEVLPKESFTRL